MISAFFTGVMGSLFANYTSYIDPYIVFSVGDVAIAMVLVVILGGIGTFWGPLVGAICVVMVNEGSRLMFANASVLIYGALVIIVICSCPRESWESETIHQQVVSCIKGDPSMLLEVNGLTKAFAGLVAVKEVDFTVQKGEILGLIGPNGAGKTTIFHLLTGYYTPTAGTVRFNGKDMTHVTPPAACRLGLTRTFQIVKPLVQLTSWKT